MGIQVSTTQAAQLVGRHERNVRRTIKQGSLPARLDGRRGWQIDVEALDRVPGWRVDQSLLAQLERNHAATPASLALRIEGLERAERNMQQRLSQIETALGLLRAQVGISPLYADTYVRALQTPLRTPLHAPVASTPMATPVALPDVEHHVEHDDPGSEQGVTTVEAQEEIAAPGLLARLTVQPNTLAGLGGTGLPLHSRLSAAQQAQRLTPEREYKETPRGQVPTGLPEGSMRAYSWAKSVRTEGSTLVRYISRGDIPATILPSARKDRLQEIWLSPEQQNYAIQVLLTKGIPVRAIPATIATLAEP